MNNNPLRLPEYSHFLESIDVLNLGLSGSELHGILCAYLCAGADNQGHTYLQALLHNQKGEASREAALALFAVFSISQQQISTFDFGFEMLLPEDDEPLFDKAQAFMEWCAGFIQGLEMVGVDSQEFDDEETQEAVENLRGFAQLDCESLDVDEEDEKALVDVSEYARMAVLRIHADLMNQKKGDAQGTAH